MSVLVIGASGFVGRALLEEFRRRARELPGSLASEGGDVFGTGHTAASGDLIPLDITSPTAVTALFARLRPLVVILAAALTHVDYCEDHPAEARVVNVTGAENVARAALATGVRRIVHISTDYVFDGRAGPYREEDAPNPVNRYGATKLEAERAVAAAFPDGHLIVRTNVVYGWDPRSQNFVMQLMRRLGRGEPMRVPVDQWSTPTHVTDLARAIRHLVERGESGVFHAGGPDFLNRYDFALATAAALGLDGGLIEPVETARLGQRAPRPLKAGLRIDKLLSTGCPRMRPPREALAEVPDSSRAAEAGPPVRPASEP